MYFITTDSFGNVERVYNGNKDYVHRLTGEPIEGAVAIPDDAIRIGNLCVQMIRNVSDVAKLRWDGTCLVLNPNGTLQSKKDLLLSQNKNTWLQAEHSRIQALDEASVDLELGDV